MRSVIKRGIDLISNDIYKKKNQLKEVVLRYSAQIKFNKARETEELLLAKFQPLGSNI